MPAGRDPVDWFLFDAKIGYCEQFATAETLMLRSLGIPARLATGYSTGDYNPVLDQSIVREHDAHAWVEVWTGRWWAYDPTNDCPVGERHVAVGRGRDYGDVPPVKGIYAGNAENTMRVAVRMARVH